MKIMSSHQPFRLALLLVWLAPAAWAQIFFIQGDGLANRTFNSDNGPTNSQLTLNFTNAQPGILQNILTWGETSGSTISGIGQSFGCWCCARSTAPTIRWCSRTHM